MLESSIAESSRDENNAYDTTKKNALNLSNSTKELNVDTICSVRDDTKESLQNLKNKDSIVQNVIPQSVFCLPTASNYYGKNGFVQCRIERDLNTSSSKLNPRYKFIFQSRDYPSYNERVALIAEKKTMYRSSIYHIYDFSRIDGIFACSSGFKLNKKAGNYIGKLKREKNERASYSLYDAKEDKEQHAAFVYYFPGLIRQWKDGQPPRKLTVALPMIGKDGRKEESRPHWIRNKILECIKKVDGYNCSQGLHVLKTKEPSYEAGQYRLNFSGRVTVPSVKNMQIINDDNEVVAQFGRIGENKFHLDYK